MCLAIIALHAHPRYRLVVAANRDEFHARAADPAAWWPEGILAGRDRVAQGTWLGITRHARWSLLTNFREGGARDPTAPSRGALVTGALRNAAPALINAASIASDGARYHGFSLLVGNREQVAYTSNRASGAMLLSHGVHGLSNHLLDTPWPKLRGAQGALARWIDKGGVDIEPIFQLLADRTQALPAHLPATGVSTHWERILSSVFIATPDYGTRCSTVLTITHDGNVAFAERTFDAEGTVTGEARHAFAATAVTP